MKKEKGNNNQNSDGQSAAHDGFLLHETWVADEPPALLHYCQVNGTETRTEAQRIDWLRECQPCDAGTVQPSLRDYAPMDDVYPGINSGATLRASLRDTPYVWRLRAEATKTGPLKRTYM